MGNRFSRRRDAPASSGETAVTEQKPAEEPAAPQPAEESTQATETQEAVETENLEVMVGEAVTPVARLPSEECTSECKEVQAPATPKDVEPKPAAEEAPAPSQPELVASVSGPSPPESEPVVVEPQLAPEPASGLVPEPESEVESVPEPIPESVQVPAKDLERQTDMLTQESLPDPALPSPPLVDLGVPDLAPQPVKTSTPGLDTANELSDIPVTEECEDSAEAAMAEPEKPEEISKSPEKSVEMEAAEGLEQLVGDVNDASLSGLLQNLELKGNDLVADLIPSDVQIPDDTPITDTTTSTELI